MAAYQQWKQRKTAEDKVRGKVKNARDKQVQILTEEIVLLISHRDIDLFTTHLTNHYANILLLALSVRWQGKPQQ